MMQVGTMSNGERDETVTSSFLHSLESCSTLGKYLRGIIHFDALISDTEIIQKHRSNIADSDSH